MRVPLDGSAVLALHRQQGGAGRQTVAIRPVTARLFDRAAFARMLNGQEQGAAVGREFAARELAAGRTARQLPQQALPSDVVVPGLMDGLENLNRLVQHAVEHSRKGGRGVERTAASKSRLRVAGRKSR